MLRLIFKCAESTDLDFYYYSDTEFFVWLPVVKELRPREVGNFLEIHGFPSWACTESIDFPSYLVHFIDISLIFKDFQIFCKTYVFFFTRIKVVFWTTPGWNRSFDRVPMELNTTQHPKISKFMIFFIFPCNILIIQWKSMKINENQWKSMKINENQWKLMWDWAIRWS